MYKAIADTAIAGNDEVVMDAESLGRACLIMRLRPCGSRKFRRAQHRGTRKRA